MVCHEYVGVNPAPEGLACIIQHCQEVTPVCIIGKDDLTVITSLNDVLGVSWEHKPRLSCHRVPPCT
jgi:hypothetical protein